MLAECSICMDSLGGEKAPFVMPCGHLYCLDCATFWFNQGDSQKCPCGRVCKGEDVIRIWASNENSQASCASNQRTSIERVGEEALDACTVALTVLDPDADQQDSSVAAALLKTDSFTRRIQRESQTPGLENILTDLRPILLQMKTILERRVQLAPPQPILAEDVAARNVLRDKAKLERQLQRITRHAAAIEQALSDQRAQTQQKEHELNRQLWDLRNAVDIARKNLASLHTENKTLKEDLGRASVEKEKAVKGEVKYKKKYHALKQEQDRIKKRARVGLSTELDQDSLIVLSS